MEYSCRTVNKSVSAGINTSMSISGGFGPSIFCRKMENARPMREEMDGRVVLFPARVGTPTFDAIPFDSTFLYVYLDLACKQLCFPPGKGINRRNESTTAERCRTFQSLSREHFIIFQELFRTFSKLLRTVSNLLQNECTIILIDKY